MWRWADSNRRPNTAPESFLHIYFINYFRGEAANEQVTAPLSFKS